MDIPEETRLHGMPSELDRTADVELASDEQVPSTDPSLQAKVTVPHEEEKPKTGEANLAVEERNDAEKSPPSNDTPAGIGIVPEHSDSDGEKESASKLFPEPELERCLEMMLRKQWVVPVQSGKELETCMVAALRFATANEDQSCEACVRFYREALPLVFTKTFLDDAAANWNVMIHTSIVQHAKRFVELCVMKLTCLVTFMKNALASSDSTSEEDRGQNGSSEDAECRKEERFRELLCIVCTFLDILAIVINPHSRLHSVCAAQKPSFSAVRRKNASSSSSQKGEKNSNGVHSGSSDTDRKPEAADTEAAAPTGESEEEEDDAQQPAVAFVYARVGTDSRLQRGYLCDLVQHFGTQRGFDLLLECATLITSFASHRTDSAASSTALNQPRSTTNTTNTNSTVTTSGVSWQTAVRTLVARLNVVLCASLLRPLSFAYEYLSAGTLRNFVAPLADVVSSMLENLSDEDVRREIRAPSSGVGVLAASPFAMSTTISSIALGNSNTGTGTLSQPPTTTGSSSMFAIGSAASASSEPTRNDAVSVCVRALKCVLVRLNQEDAEVGGARLRRIETFRFRFLVRLLELASFAGKMSSLNEINRLINCVQTQANFGGIGRSFSSFRFNASGNAMELAELEDSFGARELARWIVENRLVAVVLRENLHQPQYVEKLERIVRFLVKERVLEADDLDRIWAAQAGGKHEAIVKNVHDLLAKLAWDFSAEQLDQLFRLFQRSWQLAAGNRKQQEKLLEFIRRLAEDDKENVLVSRVLDLLFDLARSRDCELDIIAQALAAQARILDYFAQDRNALKLRWLERFVSELVTVTQRFSAKSDAGNTDFFAESHWMVLMLRHTLELLNLLQDSAFSTATALPGRRVTADGESGGGGGDGDAALPANCTRSEALAALNDRFSLVSVVVDNLCCYMQALRTLLLEKSSTASAVLVNDESFASSFSPDDRFTHADHVAERLRFLTFALGNVGVLLTGEHCARLWRALAVEGVCAHDRDACFRWLADLVAEHERSGCAFPDGVLASFFENSLLKYDPVLITPDGFNCFERFFKLVNLREGKISLRRVEAPMVNRKGRVGRIRSTVTWPAGVQPFETVVEDLDLVGFDLLWRILLDGREENAPSCARLIKELYTHLALTSASSSDSASSAAVAVAVAADSSSPLTKNAGPAGRLDIHHEFLSTCHDRLKAYFDTLTVLIQTGVCKPECSKQLSAEHIESLVDPDSSADEKAALKLQIERNVRGLSRVLSLIREYVTEYECAFQRALPRGDEERTCVPLQRAIAGRPLTVLFKFAPANNNNGSAFRTNSGGSTSGGGGGSSGPHPDDVEKFSHANELVQALRAFAGSQLRAAFGASATIRFELQHSNETVERAVDLMPIGSLVGAARDRLVLHVRYRTALRFGAPRGASYSESSSDDDENVVTVPGARTDGGDADGEADADVLPVADQERALPGYLIANDSRWIPFLFQIGDLACHLRYTQVRDTVLHLLRTLPPDPKLTSRLRTYFDSQAALDQTAVPALPLPVELQPDQTHTFGLVYSLDLLASLLLPSNVRNNNNVAVYRFQTAFVRAGGLRTCAALLKGDETVSLALSVDPMLRTQTYARLVRLVKFLLACALHFVYSMSAMALQKSSGSASPSAPVVVGGVEWTADMVGSLKQAIDACARPTSAAGLLTLTDDFQAAAHVFHVLKTESPQSIVQLLGNSGALLPDLSLIRTVQKVIWAASCGNISLATASTDELHRACGVRKPAALHSVLDAATNRQDSLDGSPAHDRPGPGPDLDELLLVREAFDCFALAVIAAPGSFDSLRKDRAFQQFVIDVLLVCRSRVVRMCALERLFFLALNSFDRGVEHKPSSPTSPGVAGGGFPQSNVLFIITLLMANLQSTVREHSAHSHELFELLKRLLEKYRLAGFSLTNLDAQLSNQVQFLKQIRDAVSVAARASGAIVQTHSVLSHADEQLLNGHLNVARELVAYLDEPRKFALGSRSDGPCLLRDLLENFLYPATRLLLLLQHSEALVGHGQSHESSAELMRSVCSVPVCSSLVTQSAAYELILALCDGCLENVRYVASRLTEFFYTPSSRSLPTSSASAARKAQLLDTNVRLSEWDYVPAVGARPFGGFVGLKNAGATCYMNAVLQQVFMIRQVRNYLLSIDLSPAALVETLRRLATQSGGSPSAPDADTEGDLIAPNGTNLDCLDDEDLVEEYGLGATLRDSFSDSLKPLSFSSSGNSGVALFGDAKIRALLLAAAGGNASRAATIEYNLAVLKQLQTIFGHLNYSRLQYYVPKGFWRMFRLSGEPVNVREQHDAVEFLNNLEDAVDEACKFLKLTPVLQHICGGTLADQKICRGCPHRYSREDPFLVLNVDVRNHPNLLEALAEYVKGDLLEGPNAYLCERCKRKVDAVKRSCIARLPSVLVIQLKRFDYDYERETPVKFNDYFEFPRLLDLEPYTVDGLARRERNDAARRPPVDADAENANFDADMTFKSAAETDGDADVDSSGQPTVTNSAGGTKYRLVGIAVHSGQANGGHYYSYILNRSGSPNDPLADGDTDGNVSAAPTNRWFKFDDNDVTECDMDKDDELRAQCFGGDYASDTYDTILKRVTPRKQKRWWNAYMLFYERLPSPSPSPADGSKSQAQPENDEVNGGRLRLPARIEQVIRLHNLKFAHSREHFSAEYSYFMRRYGAIGRDRFAEVFESPMSNHIFPLTSRKRANSTPPDCHRPFIDSAEQHAVILTELVCRYLFLAGFRTKKALRGAANDHLEGLSAYLKISWKARAWFAENILFPIAQFAVPGVPLRSSQLYARFVEYFVDCPNAEVRVAFAKLVHTTAQAALQFGDTVTPNSPLGVLVPSIVRGYPQFDATPYEFDSKSLTRADREAAAKAEVLLADLIVLSCVNMLKAGLISTSGAFSSSYSSSYEYGAWQSGSAASGRQFLPFFNLFVACATQGPVERSQLLRLGVPTIFIRYLLDELDPPGVTSSYVVTSKHPTESLRLHAAISTLVRSCSVASRCQPSVNVSTGADVADKNPHSEWYSQDRQANHTGPLMPLPEDLAEWVYKPAFVKRLIDDFASQPAGVTVNDDILRLVRFLAYENPLYTEVLLQELLVGIARCHTSDVRNVMLLLGHLLVTVDDSYRQTRLFNAFRGLTYEVPDESAAGLDDSTANIGGSSTSAPESQFPSGAVNNDAPQQEAATSATTQQHVDGIFDVILKSRDRQPKRGYFIMKITHEIFSNSDIARSILTTVDDFKQKWLICTAWLESELNRRSAIAAYGNYSTWNANSGALSNENTQSYYLEHSASANELCGKIRQLNEECAIVTDTETDAEDSEAVTGDDGAADDKKVDEDPDNIDAEGDIVESSSGDEDVYTNSAYSDVRVASNAIDVRSEAKQAVQSPSSRPPSPT